MLMGDDLNEGEDIADHQDYEANLLNNGEEFSGQVPNVTTFPVNRNIGVGV